MIKTQEVSLNCPHLDLLVQQAADGALGQALLFVGPEGAGKSAWIKMIVKQLLAKQDSHVTLENNPDIQRLDKGAKAEQVRAFIKKLSQKPYQEKFVIGIVEGIDYLSSAAVHTLLKTFEEPPPQAVLIFSAVNLEKVLPTIRSRARVIYLPALEYEKLENSISQLNWPLDPAIILWLCQGLPGYVEYWHSDLERLQAAAGIIEEWATVLQLPYAQRAILAKRWSELEPRIFEWVSLNWLRTMLYRNIGALDQNQAYTRFFKHIAQFDNAWNNINTITLSKAIQEITALDSRKLSGLQRKNIIETILLTIL